MSCFCNPISDTLQFWNQGGLHIWRNLLICLFLSTTALIRRVWYIIDCQNISRAKLAGMDNVEVKSLRQKGALSLPPWEFCDNLVEPYFEKVAPALPIIDRSRFMKQYRDPNNPPSLLVLQAIFLAASAVNSTETFATGNLYNGQKLCMTRATRTIL